MFGGSTVSSLKRHSRPVVGNVDCSALSDNGLYPSKEKLSLWMYSTIGIIVGILVGGIVLATITTIYVEDRTRESPSTKSSFPVVNVISTNFISTTTIITTSTTITTTTSTATTSTTTATTTITTTTTTTVPPSTVCTSNTSVIMYNDQFIYSPTSQIYAAGMLNNQFGIYKAYSYGNVTSTAIWTAPQTSTAQTCYLALQTDRNLVVYTTSLAVLWNAAVYNFGAGSPFCFAILDSGNLIWTDSFGSIIWQSNSAQIG